MATGHFPNCSHNFEWYGLINHDRMITLTLQNKYDTTLPSGYPKFAYPLEISLWIRNLFTLGQTLPGRFAIGSETIDRRFGVVYRDVITGSRESRVHHYDAPSFSEFWNLYCPRTIHFSWRRRASLRTLPTILIVRDWGNNGTICDSTCAARCRLLIWSQHFKVPSVITSPQPWFGGNWAVTSIYQFWWLALRWNLWPHFSVIWGHGSDIIKTHVRSFFDPDLHEVS